MQGGTTRAWKGDFPDPYVLVVDGVYYAYATTAGLIQIQELSGGSPVQLVDLHDALGTLPAWAAPFSSWAPAVLHRDDRFLLYYTALVTDTDQHCVSVAESNRPAGPFVDDSTSPLLCPTDQGGAIDPSPYEAQDGSLFLLWKNDGITLRQDSAIWSQRLRADGRALMGAPTRLIATDQRWEYPHVEAPSMARIDGDLWLAYSGNWFNQAAYGVGMARCESPRGPCNKPLHAPVLTSRPGAEGPGGLEFFRAADGEVFAAYHAWDDTPGFPNARSLWIAAVDTSSGVPSIPQPR